MKSKFAAVAVLGAMLAAPTLVFAEDVVDVGNTTVPNAYTSSLTKAGTAGVTQRASKQSTADFLQSQSMLPDGGAGAEQ